MFDTYTDLKAYVIGRIARSDYSDTQASEDIALAESIINRNLRVKDMTLSDELELVAGTRDYNLPADYFSLLSMGYDDRAKLEEVSKQRILDYPERTGKPDMYAIENRVISFGGTPDGDYTVPFSYVSRIPSLANNTSNWLLLLYPDLYIDGAMHFAFKRYRDPRAAELKSDLQNAIMAANAMSRQDDLSSPKRVMRSTVSE